MVFAQGTLKELALVNSIENITNPIGLDATFFGVFWNYQKVLIRQTTISYYTN